MKFVNSSIILFRMKDKIISFCWQHILLMISLFIMTLGVAVCVRSMLGSSVISVLPYVFQEAGIKDVVPNLTIGQYTYLMNALFVILQIIILRKRFEVVQLFQLVIGFIFGLFLDLNMLITEWLLPTVLLYKILSQIAGCTILAIGIAFEVRCGSITMPGEGLPVAISKVTGKEFPKVKILVDTSLVILGIIASYAMLGSWQWHIIGIGTLFAMIYVGAIVKFVGHHLDWFDHILSYRPGFRRYVFGLARYIYNYKRNKND